MSGQQPERSTDSDKDLICNHCGEERWTLLGGEGIYKCSEVSEFGDRLDGIVKTMRGEADELEARDDVDKHLQDVISGLRHRANEIESFLEEEYYK